MSRIAPKSSTARKPRRITANWAFESKLSSSPKPVERKALPRNELCLSPSETEMNDARKPKPLNSYSDTISDGTDSGIGSATMLSLNQEILEYMAENLMHCMKPMLALPQLIQHGLLTEKDVVYISSSKRSDEERKERVLSALMGHESDVVEKLVDCLAIDSVNASHCYMARKLREAMEKKKQYPDLPLTSLVATPNPNGKEPSPSSAAPIKPRGAAQRNSIAKLLATKRNNVAQLISQIETKETTHRQLPSRQQEHQAMLDNGDRTNDTPHVYSLHNIEAVAAAKTVSFCPTTHSSSSHSHPQTHMEASTPYQNTCLHPLTPNSPSYSISPMSPCSHPPKYPHTYPDSQMSPTVPPLNSDFHAVPPYSPPISPHHTLSPIQTHLYTHTDTPPQSDSVTFISQSHSPPHVNTSPLPHTPPSLSCDSQEDTYSTNSPDSSQTDSKRIRPVNEMVLRHKVCDSSSSCGSPKAVDIAKMSSKSRDSNSKQLLTAVSGGMADVNSHRKDLSSPTSPKSKVPMLPPLRTSESMYSHPHSYSEKSTDELPAACTPARNDDSGQEEMVPVTHRNRTTRLAGLTARFYKNRRSASMSAYDTRPFQRGNQLSASMGKATEDKPNHNDRAEVTKVRASVREGVEKLTKRRIDWLQERVQFTDCPEHIQFTSFTHYGEERELLYSGTLSKHGKARFVVLFTDYLLVLKAKRPSVPSKWVFTSQSSRIDWFSDLEYTAKKPLPLHLLTVQRQSNKQSNNNFCLHFNDKSKVIEVVLQAVSKEARDIWVEELSEAITLATAAHADTFLLVGNRALTKMSGEPYKKLQLQIHSASSLGLAANCNSFSLFCVIELGKQRCRTPSVMGGYNPFWNYKCEFTDFNDDDNLLIEVFSENIFRPNDFLGYVNIMLTSLPVEQSGRKSYDGNMILAGLEEAFAGELHICVEQGWETKM